MPGGRPLQPLHLSPEEAEQLKQLTRRPKSAQALALRARIVLACASGLSNTQVASWSHVGRPTVNKWRERFRRSTGWPASMTSRARAPALDPR